MHRSLSQYGTLTENAYVRQVLTLEIVMCLIAIRFLLFVAFSRTSELPHVSLGRPISNVQSRVINVRSSIHLAAAAQSNRTLTTSEAPVFMQEDHVPETVPSVLNHKLTHADVKERAIQTA
jgi:hypothetical protein